MKLSEIKLDESALITSIEPTFNYARRLIELGFSVGTEVTPVIKGMSGHLTAYKVKNTVIALREETADMVNVLLK